MSELENYYTKQYVIGYNAGFGTGSHGCALARCMKDLQGGSYTDGERQHNIRK